MHNRSAKRPEFTLSVPIVLVLATLSVAITTVITTTENVFAYEYNQAKSDVNSCGNGAAPTNVGCQNTDSQIQGDENAVALTAEQTFAEVAKEEPPQNNPPIADAGPDQSVEVASQVTLDGSGSFDPDGDPLTYSWTQISGPTRTLSDNTAISPTFDANSPDLTPMVFELVVNDGQQDSLPDSVVITTFVIIP